MTLEQIQQVADEVTPCRWLGKVSKVIGLVVESAGPQVSVGEMCEIRSLHQPHPVIAEVVGFREDRVLLMPLGDMHGICHGDVVVPSRRPITAGVGNGLLGRVLDGLGRPIDDKGPLQIRQQRPVHSAPTAPLQRQRITEALATGIRAIDTLFTIGKGQRMGIFSGSGVGKSILLGDIAKHTHASVNVIALIGERGREIRNFIEDNLQDALGHTVIIAATSDQPALVRVKAAFLATTIAEYFRDEGHDVLLMMDSVTRFANAQREIGLAVGEPPATRGYTPSVFALLPRLLERCGLDRNGSITGLYTVLVDGDDLNEPVSDAIRGILDGHMVLSRQLASRGHFPAIDVHASISRVMHDVVTEEQVAAARQLLAIAYKHREAEDIISIGAYHQGSNPEIDHAIAMIGPINEFLCQGIGECGDMPRDVERMTELAYRTPETAPVGT